MVIFPNCKINLGLHILRKRTDGYHDLQTVFFPVGLLDALEVIQVNNQKEPIHYSHSGLPVAGEVTNNLCVKAFSLLKKDFPQIPSSLLHLHKNIPLGAGLGGGSSDGAHTLLLFNQLYQLNLSQDQLINYALALGSDCPFFIINKPCLAEGRGEKLTPIALDLSAFDLVMINPGIHINTGWAFSRLTPSDDRASLVDIIQEPVENWKSLLKNDFEEPVYNAHPAIESIKEKLYNEGALYASLSGSGSTVYGLFKKGKSVEITVPENYKMFRLSL